MLSVKSKKEGFELDCLALPDYLIALTDDVAAGFGILGVLGFKGVGDVLSVGLSAPAVFAEPLNGGKGAILSAVGVESRLLLLEVSALLQADRFGRRCVELERKLRI